MSFAAAAAKFKAISFTPELREQIEDAGFATQKAFANLRRIVHMETGEGVAAVAVPSTDEVFNDKVKDKDKALSSEVLIMKPIFRFFQLLCENHNLELQASSSVFVWLMTSVVLLLCCAVLPVLLTVISSAVIMERHLKTLNPAIEILKDFHRETGGG